MGLDIIAKFFDLETGKLLVETLDLLQAERVRLRLLEIGKQMRKPLADGVDVPCGDAQGKAPWLARRSASTYRPLASKPTHPEALRWTSRTLPRKFHRLFPPRRALAAARPPAAAKRVVHAAGRLSERVSLGVSGLYYAPRSPQKKVLKGGAWAFIIL